MRPVFDGDKLFYCVGARTAIGIEPCDPALAGERFVQQRVGLHHLCLRARSRDDVDRCAALLKEMDATSCAGRRKGIGPRATTTCCSVTENSRYLRRIDPTGMVSGRWLNALWPAGYHAHHYNCLAAC